jgi:hypothetical protein
MMKNIILFIFLIIILSCQGQDNNYINLNRNVLLKTIYNSNELDRFEEIIYRTDSLVLSKTNNNNINKAYHEYCRDLTNAYTVKGLEDLLEDDKFFYNDLVNDLRKEKLFYEIFCIIKLKNENNAIHEKLGINLEGKYMKTLKKLSSKDIVPDTYYNHITSFGEIGPTAALGLLENHNNYNFNKSLIRMVFTIHFISIHSFNSKL